jgi:hypothetical protein
MKEVNAGEAGQCRDEWPVIHAIVPRCRMVVAAPHPIQGQVGKAGRFQHAAAHS